MVKYVRVAGARLHVPQSQAADPASARIYFVGPASLPATINPSKEYTHGTVVLAPRLSAAVWPHVLNRLSTIVDQLNSTGRRQIALLSAGGGLRSDGALRVGNGTVVEAGDWVVVGSPELRTAWQLLIPQGTSFRGEATRLALTLPAGAAQLELPGNATIPIPEMDGRCSIDIDWDGVTRGTLRFRAPVDAGQLEALGAGPRFFARSQEDADASKILVSTLTYPLFALGEGRSEPFEFQIDYASPHDDEADGAFEAAARRPRSTLTPPDRALPTHLHQVHAGEVLLKPAQAQGQPKGFFALTASPRVLDLQSGSPQLQRGEHYFTPMGAFAVQVEDPAREHLRLTLGLSHLENMTVRASDRLVFERSRPAYDRLDDRGFASSGTEAEAADPLVDLNGTCTTSWLRLVRGPAEAEDDPFSLQPEGMQAYVTSTTDARVLDFHEVRYSNAGAAFPLAPLLGVRRGAATTGHADAPERLQFERRVLALVRRQKITGEASNLPLASAAEAETLAARTPQGYLASRSGAARAWSQIVFTKTSPREAAPGAFPELRTLGLSAPAGSDAAAHLASVLAQNRLMLVTTWKKLEALHFALADFDRIHVAGWGIRLSARFHPVTEKDLPALPAGFDPIVVIKYADRSIADLARDESQWALLDTFSDPAIRSRFRKILDAADGDGLQKPLARRLNDPNWNGLLLLDGLLPLTGIPAQMRAIAGGLPPYLEVPYAGLDITGIDPDQPAGEPWKSALFGLVRHDDPAIGFSIDGRTGIGMRVPKLIVRVENDGIDRFDCKLELRLPGLFDVKATKPDDDLKLEGRYESSIVDGRRRETYTFLAEGEFTKTFDPPGVVKSATFRRLRLVTNESEGLRTTGSFMIDGSIAFHKVLDPDLFGIERLDFTDLAIDLDFLIGQLARINLDLNYPKLKLDLDLFNSGEGRRPTTPGFLKAFPLKLRGFRFGDFKLPDLGFISLGSLVPDASSRISDHFRFGFDFDMDLGSLGALAEKFDRFKLQVVLGWKPRIEGGSLKWNDIAAGFRIDFGKGGGGIDLGVQGILRLWAERFNLKRVGDVFVLSADDCHIDILGKVLPEDGQTFSLFLFANPKGGQPFERLGWFASFRDTHAKDPLKVESLVLAQRVDVNFDSVNTTSKALKWLNDAQDFSGSGGTEKFVAFAGDKITYDRNREWFLALKGDFFKVLRLGLVLKDPDMYGVYLGFLAKDDSPQSAPMSFDLLYQKLADGVGRYSVEVGLPPGYRTFECGVVSVTLGMIRMEVYTDGAFLFDLGFPEHVDYTRSFAVQAAIFIGKGGLYLGRVPAVTVPGMPAGYQQVFRTGFAMKVGFGREFEQGPLRAGLSICVFGRMEGYFAIADQGQRRPDGRPLAPYPYWMRLHGEVGLIAEIEGCVDLRLIRARVLVRVWIATGMVLETALPIVLYCEAGVSVAIEFEIASFKVFGKRIRITVMLRFSTRLRYEFQLPAKVPVFKLPGVAEAMALPAPEEEEARPLGDWPEPSAARLGVTAQPIDLRLGYDFTAAGRNGTADGGYVGPVLVPTVMWMTGDDHNGDRNPFETIVRALIGWAALRARPASADAALIELRKDPGAELDLPRLEESLRGVDDIPFATLEGLFTAIAPGSRLRHIPEGEHQATGFLFPVPPALALRLTCNGGEQTHDFATLGTVSAQTANGIFADLQRQFAEIDVRSRPAAMTEADEPQPLVNHIFRSWCTALALSACDAARTEWRSEQGAAQTRTVGAFLDALTGAHWNDIASRAGRLLLSGARVRVQDGTRPLAEMAGLFMAFPAGAADTRLDPVEGRGPSWLAVEADPMEVKWATLAAVASAPVTIERKPEVVPAARLVARRFYQPPALAVRTNGGNPTAYLCRFSGDFLASGAATALAELLFSAAMTSDQVGQPATDSVRLESAQAALVFEMTLARLPVAGDTGLVEADGVKFMPSAFRISGASEADRLGLDALIEGMAVPGSTLSLESTRLLVGWQEGEEPTASLTLLPLATTELRECVVARSTVSIERRPADQPAAAEAEAVQEDPESRFLATFEPRSRHQLLYLLRRAAIVNSEGTNLLLPEPQAKLVRALFEQAGAGRRTIRLTFAVVFAAGTGLPPGVRNAALFEAPADLQRISQPSRRIVAELAAVAGSSSARGMVEAISTRPAGTDLVRTWRKRSAVNGAAAATEASLGTHLAQRFDMLEFQLRVAGSAEPLLSFAQSLPLASEEAVPPATTPDAGGAAYPEQLREQLAAALPGDYQASDLRYDLIVPLSKLCDPAGGPYVAIGQAFELDLGWRDVYGNRLGASADPVRLEPRYTDTVVPLAAWPCVKARVHPGAKGSRTLVLALSVDGSAVPGSQEDRLSAANELRRVIFQVSDRNAEPKVRCGLGAPAGTVDATALRAFLEPLEAALRVDQAPAANEWKHEIRVAVSTAQAFLPLSVEFSVVRPEALVAGADGRSHLVPGTADAWSPVRMDSITGARPEKPDFQRDFATEFQLAFSFAEGSRNHIFWAALGTVPGGAQDWWAMNDGVIPEPLPVAPMAYGVPPMARALMGAQVTAQVAQEPDFATQKPLSVLVRDQDVDALLAAFLDRVETFISPAHAQCTALASPDRPDAAMPFESVARAKGFLLGKADEPSPLLQALRTVFAGDAHDAARHAAASAELREACAPDLRRFYEVGCVMVKDLKPRLEPDWVTARGHLRPKLYGQLKFAHAAGQAASFRTMTRGIALDPHAMQIALPVIPDLQSDASEADLGRIDYEVTHVERAVKGQGGEVLEASRWLTLVPVLGPVPLPSIRITDGDKAPLPRRRVPAPVAWGQHTFAAYDQDTVAATYEGSVQAARRWTYGFEVQAEFAETDEVCGRLLYNLPAGSASAAGEAPQSAAQPIIEGLFERLAAHELEVAPYWQVILSERKRRSAGEAPLDAFVHACNRFAESVARVVQAFAPRLRTEDEAKGPDQDRFIVTDALAEVGGAPGRKTTIRFADHFLGEAPVAVFAGEGKPWLRIRRILAGSKPEGSQAGVGANGQGIDPSDVRADFMFAGTQEQHPGRRSREIQIGRLDALRQQSVWVAASVRRNRSIGDKPLDEGFVYRTPESFLHQAMSPQLLHRERILLAPAGPLTLQELIVQGLRPVLQDVAAERGVYVQLSADYESGRLTELVETWFGAVGTDNGFALQPDPKVILAATKVTDGAAGAMALGAAAAARLHQWFAREPVGKAADGSRGRILLNVTVSALSGEGPGQTILQLERLGLDLTRISDL